MQVENTNTKPGNVEVTVQRFPDVLGNGIVGTISAAGRGQNGRRHNYYLGSLLADGTIGFQTEEGFLNTCRDLAIKLKTLLGRVQRALEPEPLQLI